MSHQPHTGDIGFILFDVLQATKQLQALSPFAETDTDLMQQVLEEAARFVADKVAPIRREGDEVGAVFSHGTVAMPPGSRVKSQHRDSAISRARRMEVVASNR